MRRSVFQFFASMCGSAYTVYLLWYFHDISADLSFSGSVAALIVTPHILCCTLAVIFGWLAFFENRRIFALTSAILYCSAAVIFMKYGPYLIPMIALGFVGYVMIGRIQKARELEDCNDDDDDLEADA